LRNKLVKDLKEAAKILINEGELTSNLYGFKNEEYDMDEHTNRMERIIQRNLKIYGNLYKRFYNFKNHMQ